MAADSPSSRSPASSDTSATSSTDLDYDVILVGAGMSGLYMLYRLRELNLRVKVIEAGTGVGGTWYWNRYPGARFDSESYSYAYSFSPSLLAEWDWKEHFAPQPETLAYLNHVADKFDLRRDIQFRSRVSSAYWDEACRTWAVRLEDSTEEALRCRFFITAIGPLSTPTMPRILGVDDFEGESMHTARWPRWPVSFAGKRVAVIGTGATGVQTIQEVVKTCGSLTVFQRTPNWCAPLHNAKIGKEEMEELRRGYPAMFQRCRETFACFLHSADPRGTFEVSEEVREAFWEELYKSKGFGIWQGNFQDVLVDETANAEMSRFVAGKIRQRVKDQGTAEKLIPRNHGFGTRRVPLETRYYEAYNQENVRLVDITEEGTPIECVTRKGIKTTEKEHEFDMIIYATGFDAITGSFNHIDIRGVEGARLKERWAKGPKTYLGLFVDEFPNMLMVMGPHTALGNIPRSIEYSVDWLGRMLADVRERGITRVEATAKGVAEWTATVDRLGGALLSANVDSWMTGVNSNVEGKQTRYAARYSGSSKAYRDRCEDVARDGYREMLLS